MRHLIGAAVGWGGNPEKDAYYVLINASQNDGKIAYRVRVPADHPGMERRRAAIPAATGDSRGEVDLPPAAAGEVISPAARLSRL